MKINCNFKRNFFKCTNEAIGVNLDKHKILKKKKLTTYTYTEHSILILIIILILSAIFALSTVNFALYISLFLIVAAGIYLIIDGLIILAIYLIRKKNGLKNSIIVDENGITDHSFLDIKMIFAWKKILGIVVRANTVVILTDTPVYFYFPRKQEKEIVEAIKKYKKNIPVIK